MLVHTVFPKKNVSQSAVNGSRECGRNRGNNGFGGREKHSHGRGMSVMCGVTGSCVPCQRRWDGKQGGRKTGMVLIIAFVKAYLFDMVGGNRERG